MVKRSNRSYLPFTTGNRCPHPSTFASAGGNSTALSTPAITSVPTWKKFASASDVLFPEDLGERLVTIHSRASDGDSPLHVMVWRRDTAGAEVLVAAGADINAVGDMGETPLHVAVSRGDEELVRFPDHQGWHFPRTAQGEYAGHHPEDSQAAIVHLEEMRAAGAGFLVLPRTAFWWLDYYGELAEHLELHAHRIVDDGDGCLIFALERRPAHLSVVPASRSRTP